MSAYKKMSLYSVQPFNRQEGTYIIFYFYYKDQPATHVSKELNFA